jgi:hypothetical protein
MRLSELDCIGWLRWSETVLGKMLADFAAGPAPEQVDQPVRLLARHDLVERMMAGAIRNRQQLDAWAARR